MSKKPFRSIAARNNEDAEWYTPAYIIETAREVLGSINLDPASSDLANETVQATQYYTVEDDGLTQDWPLVTTFMNPPYARGVIEPFINKFVESVNRGGHPGGIVLVNNSTETRWFQALLQASSAICLVRGRIRFLKGGNESGQGLQGSIVAYAGPNPEFFAHHFKQYGPVFMVYD